jgi:hypothetical protein
MSANDNFEWIFNNSDVNLGSNINDDRLSFQKTYDNSRLVGDGFSYYNVNSYESIIYTNLEHVLTHNNSFTLSITLKESFTDLTKPVNLFTLGYHTKGSKNTCITVGRKAATGDVVLGTINDLTSIKGTPSDSSSLIYSDVSYEYVLVHNNLEIDNNRFHLYINETGSSGYRLICDSSGLPNISILLPKLFIGSSLWTNEPEWNNQFDLCDVTLTSNIQLTVGKTIYPVNILSGSITENPSNVNINIDDTFTVSFKTVIRIPTNRVIAEVSFSSTTSYPNISLTFDSRVFDGFDYEYTFTGVVTEEYEKSVPLNYIFDLNGTTHNEISTLTVGTGTIETPIDSNTFNATNAQLVRNATTNLIVLNNTIRNLTTNAKYSLPLFIQLRCSLTTTTGLEKDMGIFVHSHRPTFTDELRSLKHDYKRPYSFMIGAGTNTKLSWTSPYFKSGGSTEKPFNYTNKRAIAMYIEKISTLNKTRMYGYVQETATGSNYTRKQLGNPDDWRDDVHLSNDEGYVGIAVNHQGFIDNFSIQTVTGTFDKDSPPITLTIYNS